MSLPAIVSREEWLSARVQLLAREKELTRQLDALNADRRRLPMVRMDKDYRFDGPQGTVRLRDMFGDSRQLVLQHVMFDPAWEDACPGCTGGLDEVNDGLLRHLAARQTAFVAVSRAPLAKLQNYADRRGWTFPWYSSGGSDFNYDFGVTLDPAVAPIHHNYRDEHELRASSQSHLADGGVHELSGMSCFLRDGDEVFHTYSTFGRGTEQIGGTYGFLDMTALGRQEDWEEPKGRNETVLPPAPFFEDVAPSPTRVSAVEILSKSAPCC
ncbi:MAG: DUF899 domain-containing protein [Hamadaea sp.]|nr:DUF899 domain-containing protein [Hamadaea sp.]